MTEEIIINGVNVAGCSEFLKPDGCDDTDCASFQCDRNTNCYYKQLKRLEQENKELKIKLSSTKCHLCGEGFLTPEGAELYDEKESYCAALGEIREIAKFNQFYNPEDLLINGDIGQIQDLKMTEIYNKINEVLE